MVFLFKTVDPGQSQKITRPKLGKPILSKSVALQHWPLDRLIEYERNPRKNDHAVAQTAAAIAQFGFRVPILAKSDGLIVDGHLRLKAARQLGLATVPVLLADDMTEAQLKAFRLSVNKIADLAQWDDALLALDLAELQDLKFDMAAIGFSAEEIAALTPPIQTGLTDEDAVPEVQPDPITKPDEVWLLGKHRLMCGDATQAGALERLCAQVGVDLLLTDPPYNVAYGGAKGNAGQQEQSGWRKAKHPDDLERRHVGCGVSDISHGGIRCSGHSDETGGGVLYLALGYGKLQFPGRVQGGRTERAPVLDLEKVFARDGPPRLPMEARAVLVWVEGRCCASVGHRP